MTAAMIDAVDVKSLDIQLARLDEQDLEEIKNRHGSTRQWPESPYHCDDNLNQRVVLYDGDIELLRAEAVVNPSNEHLTQLDYISKLAGSELEKFVRKKLRNCPTGEARLSPGFASNYNYVIHAVPPKYKSKYKTAAETALFHTYFRILEIMLEKKIRSCVMPLLTTSKGNLPLEEHSHIQLRTLRKLLEKKRQDFDRIVLHLRAPDEMQTHSLIFRCYFPQTQLDQTIACYLLKPDQLGGPNGEPIIPERQIRIKGKPSGDDNSVDLRTGLDLSTVVGKTPFSQMRDLKVPPSEPRENLNCRALARPTRRQLCSIV